MGCKVVVIQTAAMAADMYRAKLEQANPRIPEESYFVTDDPDKAAEKIRPEEGQQLLITGIFHRSYLGGVEAAADFVRRAKLKNPQLKAVNFSSYRRTGEPYDGSIWKGPDGGSKNFVDCVWNFLVNLVDDQV